VNDIIISVDGPSGSGKEKIAKYISKKYNLYHLDSGILYRRLTYLTLKKKINFKNKNELIFFLNSLTYLSPKKHKTLRKEVISKQTSIIATIPIVRKFIDNQQKLAVKKMLKSKKGCVVDGRDIGSKVFKNAKIKLFIEVKPEIRAKRRHKQLIEQGEKSIYSRILKNINLRDNNDRNRTVSPLIVPKKAIIIDNSYSFKNTIYQIKKALKKL
jgi:cytidylate kinase|tara:strand:+ start:650 stop:1288 length:639 start_codon:yes stop_codon:yes gene_type:complete